MGKRRYSESSDSSSISSDGDCVEDQIHTLRAKLKALEKRKRRRPDTKPVASYSETEQPVVAGQTEHLFGSVPPPPPPPLPPGDGCFPSTSGANTNPQFGSHSESQNEDWFLQEEDEEGSMEREISKSFFLKAYFD